MNSISLPGGKFYYYSSISSSYDVPSSSSILGKKSSKEYRRPAIIDLHFNFDKKTNKTKADLRMIWKYQNQDIEINKDNQDDRVELGVFGPQIDSESIIGAKVVFGADDEPSVYYVICVYIHLFISITVYLTYITDSDRY